MADPHDPKSSSVVAEGIPPAPIPPPDLPVSAQTLAEQWLSRQVATEHDDDPLLDEGDCRLCGHPAGEGHEPTDPCGIVTALLAALDALSRSWDAVLAQARGHAQKARMVERERDALAAQLAASSPIPPPDRPSSALAQQLRDARYDPRVPWVLQNLFTRAAEALDASARARAEAEQTIAQLMEQLRDGERERQEAERERSRLVVQLGAEAEAERTAQLAERDLTRRVLGNARMRRRARREGRREAFLLTQLAAAEQARVSIETHAQVVSRVSLDEIATLTAQLAEAEQARATEAQRHGDNLLSLVQQRTELRQQLADTQGLLAEARASLIDQVLASIDECRAPAEEHFALPALNALRDQVAALRPQPPAGAA